jgi:uncharacterized protein (DUF58 family)
VGAYTAAGLSRRLNPFSPLLAVLRTRTAAWVRRRQGEDQLPVTLERRRLYILPTSGGVAFAALVFVMLLAGLNYSNSLALYVTFLLAAWGLVVMQLCHRNLLGIAVTAAQAPAVFAQRPATLLVTLSNNTRAARLQLEGGVDGAPSVSADLPPATRRQLAIPLGPRARGVTQIGRVRIATAYPFGLFRAWTWVHTPIELIVYPAPAGSLPMPAQNVHQPGTRTRGGSGVDEWMGLRPFRDGDSPRQVDWKAYAREAPLLVKVYQPVGSELRLFEFASVPGTDVEARLRQLARWVVDAEAGGEHYGLALPGALIAPNRGPEHRHVCLAQLARCGGETVGGA